MCPEGADEGPGFTNDIPPGDEAPGGVEDPHPAVPATFSRGEKVRSAQPSPPLSAVEGARSKLFEIIPVGGREVGLFPGGRLVEEGAEGQPEGLAASHDH